MNFLFFVYFSICVKEIVLKQNFICNWKSLLDLYLQSFEFFSLLFVAYRSCTWLRERLNRNRIEASKTHTRYVSWCLLDASNMINHMSSQSPRNIICQVNSILLWCIHTLTPGEFLRFYSLIFFLFVFVHMWYHRKRWHFCACQKLGRVIMQLFHF